MKGKCFIFSAPSGAGKTTIVRHLLGLPELRLCFSISATTRRPRSNEIDGEDYYFLDEREFLRRVDAGDFVEWEEVYAGQFYGTLKSELGRIWKAGMHAIFDVDVVGGLELKATFGEDALAVFVCTPDIATLETRLRSRATESDEKIAARIKKAAFEMDFADRFDVVVENSDLDQALANAKQVVKQFIRS